MLQDLLELGKLLGNIDSLKDVTERFDKIQERSKSISERARKNIFMFPVIYSNSLLGSNKNEELQTHLINRFLEYQYAGFIYLASGLDPISRSKNTSGYMNVVFGSETLKHVKLFENNNVSIEVVAEQNIKDYTIRKSFENSFNVYNGIKSEYNNDDELKKNNIMLLGESTSSVVTVDTLLDTVKNFKPLVINIKIKFESIGDIEFPIVLKCNPHVSDTRDIVSLFESVFVDRDFLFRLFKATTGEISFIKDFIFSLDLAEKDKRLYKKFNKHPWFRILEKNKNKNIIFNLVSFIKNDQNIKNLLPTMTFVCTKDELIEGSKIPYAKIISNPEKIFKFVEKTFLLSLVVVDNDTNTINVYYNGFDKPMSYSFKEVNSIGGGGGSAGNSDKISENLSKVLLRLSERL